MYTTTACVFVFNWRCIAAFLFVPFFPPFALSFTDGNFVFVGKEKEENTIFIAQQLHECNFIVR